MSNQDDDFGGFEEAVSSNTSSNELQTSSTKLPEWLLDTPPRSSTTDKSPNTSINTNSTNAADMVKLLQEELSRTKELLLDQQTSYLQLQTQHRQELEETGSSAGKTLKDFQGILEKALSKQREMMINEFKNYQIEQETRILHILKEINIKYEHQLNERFETKLAEFQGSLIKHCESGFEDMEIKMKHAIDASLKDEFLGDKLKLKQRFEQLEKELKTDIDKHIQTYFRNQSETYKEQIKSGVMQEHLIHKDLINSKLEKLFKASEDKRRMNQLLFTRHLSGLNFFVDNAHKQLGILREAYKDLLKNKDIIDYYGDEPSPNSIEERSENKDEHLINSLSSISLFGFSRQNKKEKSDSKDNIYSMDDERLLDEKDEKDEKDETLLQDLQ